MVEDHFNVHPNNHRQKIITIGEPHRTTLRRCYFTDKNLAVEYLRLPLEGELRCRIDIGRSGGTLGHLG
jgi:hypothetical protein